MIEEKKLTEKDLLICAANSGLQSFVAVWREETFGKVDTTSVEVRCAAIRRVMAECEELGAILLGEPDSKVKEEMADVAITLFAAADIFHFDLLGAVVEKMKINLTREWVSDGNGTGHHIKKSPLESQS